MSLEVNSECVTIKKHCVRIAAPLWGCTILLRVEIVSGLSMLEFL